MTQCEHNSDLVHSLVHCIPCPSQASPSEGYRTPSAHPAKLQHNYSWFAIFLSLLSPRTSQHLQKPMDVPVLWVSESTTRSRASDIATEQRQKTPQTFSTPLWGWTASLWKAVTILDYFLMCPVCAQSNLFSFFSKSIIPALPWINDAQHLNVTRANSLETLLITSQFTIKSFILRSRPRLFFFSPEVALCGCIFTKAINYCPFLEQRTARHFHSCPLFPQLRHNFLS